MLTSADSRHRRDVVLGPPRDKQGPITVGGQLKGDLPMVCVAEVFDEAPALRIVCVIWDHIAGSPVLAGLDVE